MAICVCVHICVSVHSPFPFPALICCTHTRKRQTGPNGKRGWKIDDMRNWTTRLPSVDDGLDTAPGWQTNWLTKMHNCSLRGYNNSNSKINSHSGRFGSSETDGKRDEEKFCNAVAINSPLNSAQRSIGGSSRSVTFPFWSAIEVGPRSVLVFRSS